MLSSSLVASFSTSSERYWVALLLVSTVERVRWEAKTGYEMTNEEKLAREVPTEIEPFITGLHAGHVGVPKQ